METIWDIQQPDADRVEELCQALHIDPLAAALLVNRGITAVAAARRHLSASLADIQPPPTVQDIEAAVERIARALTEGEKILVFGDYDVDGVTGTAILLDFLAQAGAQAGHYIPHRRREGYGLQTRHIHDVVLAGRYSLVVTVDCGIASHLAVEEANRNGIDVIITDHHQPGSGPLPPAQAIVNPKRDDCPAGLAHLAGVGMAFYLLIALRTHLRRTGFWSGRDEPNLKQLCDLVALGTVADMVPLVNENRTFTRTGLQLMAGRRRPGLRALMASCRIAPGQVEADDISFRLAPRINAAGRMAHADLALELLTTADPDTANRLADRLDDLNRQRQQTEQAMVDDIIERLENAPQELNRPAILLRGTTWHEGVLGIVAARLVRRYAKPVILVSGNGDLARGSGRSWPQIDLMRVLQGCADLLQAFGGHAMAAGLTVAVSQWDAFRQRFWEQLAADGETAALRQRLPIDMEIALEAVDQRLFDILEHLKPFGESVPEPVFMARDVEIVSQRTVGGRHRRMQLRSQSGSGARPVAAIQFNAGTDRKLPSRLRRIAFHVRRHTWNGASGHQLQIIAADA